MIIYLVYDRKWEDKDILYVGTEESIATVIFQNGDHNRFIESWTNGQRISWTQGDYKSKIV